jgi:4-amino-4-deoxy-L-arabinose transferase-like glycosyltransferase
VSVDRQVAAPPLRVGGLEAAAVWVETHAKLVLGAFSALYLALTIPIAARLPLSNDEFFTYYIARAHGLNGIRRALESGAEQTPPLSHVLARIALALFGNSKLALRLPEVLAYLGASLFLYAFVTRRSSRLYGLIAVLVPAVTLAYAYSYEARSYALVLLFGAFALLCWQRCDSSRRRLALAGLALGLALATASNYYAVLLLLPLGLGEALHALRARRVRFAVWLAFGAAFVPLVVLLPLIRASRKYSAHFYSKATWHDPTDFYAFLTKTSLMPARVFVDHDRAIIGLAVVAIALLVLVVPRLPVRGPALVGLGSAIVLLPLGGLLVANALGVTLYWRELALVMVLAVLAAYVVHRARQGTLGPRIPPHELAAATGFILLPLATVVLAKSATGAFEFRYALPAVIGAAVVVPLALSRLERARPAVGLLLLAVLFVGWLGYAVSENRRASSAIERQQTIFRFLETRTGMRLPILLVHPHDYLELASIAPRPLAPRVIYLADPQAALRRGGSDTVELGLEELRKLGPLHVYDYGRFVGRRPRFLALVTFHHGDRTWVFPQLRADGMTIRLRESQGDLQLYDVAPSIG